MHKDEAMLQLRKYATEFSGKVRDDLWQVEFEDVIRRGWNKRTVKDCIQHLKLMQAAMRRTNPGDVNTFFTVSITLNKVRYDLPLRSGTVMIMLTALEAVGHLQDD